MSIASRPSRHGRLIAGAIALLTLAIAGVTNPNQADYVDYASTALVHDFQDALCGEPGSTADRSLLEQTTALLQTGCPTAITSGGAWSNQLLSDWINTATHRQNYGLFSVYRTEVPGEDFKTIAAFGNFVRLPPR